MNELIPAFFQLADRLGHRPITEDERIEWPLTRAEGRMILDALIAVASAPVPYTGCEPGPELDALIEYAAEYWGECDDPGQPWEPCS